MNCTFMKCECNAYVASTSRWLVGKCNTCNHPESRHTGKAFSPGPPTRGRAQSAAITYGRSKKERDGLKFLEAMKQGKTTKGPKITKGNQLFSVVEESKSNKIQQNQIDDLQKKISELKQQNKSQQNQINQHKTSKNSLNEALKQITTHEQTIKDLNDIANDAQRQRLEIQKENEALKQQMNEESTQLKKKHKTEMDKQKRLMKQLQNDNQKLKAQNREYSQYKTQTATMTQQHEALKKEMETLREKTKNDKDALKTRNGELTKQITTNAQTQRLQVQQQNEKMKQMNEEWTQLKNKHKTELDQEKRLMKQLQDENQKLAAQHREYSEYKTQSETMTQQMDALKIRNEELSKQIPTAGGMEEHADCDEAMDLLRGDLKVFQQQEEKWKSQYFDKLNVITSMRKEKQMLKEKVNELKCALTKQSLRQKHISAPCDDDDDPYVSWLSNDDLCTLQNELERYGIQYKKSKTLKELRRFDCEAKVIRDWTQVLKKNHYNQLADKLLEQYEDSDINETLVYHMLFDVVVECYDALHTEYYACKITQHLNVVDAIWLNVEMFYDLKRRCVLEEAMANVFAYVERKVKQIQNQILNKYAQQMDEETVSSFIVQCSQIIWSVLHYEYTIDPMHFEVNMNDTKYDEKIYEREGCHRGAQIKYCTYPALMNDEDVHQTKVWVICDDIE
eukprot:200438_1